MEGQAKLIEMGQENQSLTKKQVGQKKMMKHEGQKADWQTRNGRDVQSSQGDRNFQEGGSNGQFRKVKLPVLCFEEEAFIWCQWEDERSPLTNWPDLKN